MGRSYFKHLAFVSLLLILILISFTFYKKPVYNWDLLPYSALILSKPGMSPDSIHKLTYEKAAEQIPAKEFQLLTDTSNYYRSQTLNDAKIFTEELKYYKVKPLFIKAVSFFFWLGFPLIVSTVMPSVISYILIGLMIFTWLKRYCTPLFSFLLSLILCLLPFMLWTARTSSPDMLNALLIFTGLYLLKEKNKLFEGLMLLFISTFVRPDSILLFSLVLMWLTYDKKITIKMLLAFHVVALAALFITLKLSNFDGHVLFIQQSSSYRLANGLSDLSIQNYFVGIVKGIKSLMYCSLSFVLFIVLVLYGFKKPANTLAQYIKQHKLILILLAHIFILYLIRPNIEDRFIVADYICILLLAFDSTKDNLLV